MRLAHISEVLLPVMLAATASAQTKPTIVLVHGAFADAAGWSDVIGRLQKPGYNVVAVENPLTGLAVLARGRKAGGGNTIARRSSL